MKHLTETEIAAWVTGQQSPAMKEHVESCLECRKQTATLSAALQQFRQSAHDWADQKMPPVRIPRHKARWQSRPLWAVAALVMALLASLPAYERYRHHRETQAVAAVHAQETAQEAEDSALLRQVDVGISRAVPEPLEPLVPLVAWNTGASTGQ